MGALVAGRCATGSRRSGSARRARRSTNDFEHARHAAQRDVDRESGEREQAADQARRDERAMPRGRQRVVPRRRMHQAVDEIRLTGAIEAQRSLRPGISIDADALPFLLAAIVSERLKRTLRPCGSAAAAVTDGQIPPTSRSSFRRTW